MFLSVGNADDCGITVVKTGKKRWFDSKKKYKVKIWLSDCYDFRKFNEKDGGKIIRIINNYLGYYPLLGGALVTYKWKIKHEFYYYR